MTSLLCSGCPVVRPLVLRPHPIPGFHPGEDCALDLVLRLGADERIHRLEVAEEEGHVAVEALVLTPLDRPFGGRRDHWTRVWLERPLGSRRVVDAGRAFAAVKYARADR